MDIYRYRQLKASNALPKIGDMVRIDRAPEYVGTVIDTFYENGEGGMHVRYAHGEIWTCCTEVTIIGRALEKIDGQT